LGTDDRVRVDGKFFAVGADRFSLRGVTYGTFRPRQDGSRFPEREQVKLDFAAMHEAGFTTVRTYTPPPDDVIDLAADWGLRILAGAFYTDWRYQIGQSRREQRRIAEEAARIVRETARQLAGNEQVLALSLGNEVPADVLRWLGTDRVAHTIRELADVVREVDPGLLVTYGNYPTAEYLPLESLDFLTFNVFLEDRNDFRRYLTRLHHLAGDRPLVLGELGLHAGATSADDRRQAEAIDWQLEVATERGVAGTCIFSWTDEWWVGDAEVTGWCFGLTTGDRSPRPALDIAQRWNARTVRDIDFPWPSMSIVVCAYNSEATLDECLAHTCALDYPGLEILVVDDGSTDATAEIARRYQRVELLQIPHAGLSVARNEGLRHARGDLIAYLDSDAYPSPEWPFYLALAFDGPDVGGAGGPNIPPTTDPLQAQMVARAPGGPVHVLVSDDRAEHVPGCNMAFWREVLDEVGGFDPIYTSAGDDVDLCWKVLDRDWAIGFHPAALVWHHRRSGLRPYLRQQRGYGRSEALVEARHPARFTPTGTARWRGRIYNSLTPTVGRQRIYRGAYGAAAYQSVYQGGGYLLDLLHQVGLPLAALIVLVSAPLVVVHPMLGLPALVALIGAMALGVVDVANAEAPRHLRDERWRFRIGVAIHHILQPFVRSWGRYRSRSLARRDVAHHDPLPAPTLTLPGGIVVLPEDRPRVDVAAAVVARLRQAGARVVPPSGWEDFDARLGGLPFIEADVQTSGYPEGFVQLRMRIRVRGSRVLVALVVSALLALLDLRLGTAAALLVLAETTREALKARVLFRQATSDSASQAHVRGGTPVEASR
jgi:O-antigen biosynthesis protein